MAIIKNKSLNSQNFLERIKSITFYEEENIEELNKVVKSALNIENKG